MVVRIENKMSEGIVGDDTLDRLSFRIYDIVLALMALFWAPAAAGVTMNKDLFFFNAIWNTD